MDYTFYRLEKSFLTMEIMGFEENEKKNCISSPKRLTQRAWEEDLKYENLYLFKID